MARLKIASLQHRGIFGCRNFVMKARWGASKRRDLHATLSGPIWSTNSGGAAPFPEIGAAPAGHFQSPCRQTEAVADAIWVSAKCTKVQKSAGLRSRAPKENPPALSRRRVSIADFLVRYAVQDRNPSMPWGQFRSRYCFSLLAAAVSPEQLREDSALSNRTSDSTTAGVCATRSSAV